MLLKDYTRVPLPLINIYLGLQKTIVVALTATFVSNCFYSLYQFFPIHIGIHFWVCYEFIHLFIKTNPLTKSIPWEFTSWQPLLNSASTCEHLLSQYHSLYPRNNFLLPMKLTIGSSLTATGRSVHIWALLESYGILWWGWTSSILMIVDHLRDTLIDALTPNK